MIAIDTNLLIYAHRAATPEHGAARRAIERAARAEVWGFAPFTVSEFWAVVTHPDATGRPSTAAEASRFLSALFDAGAIAYAPGPEFSKRLIGLARDLKIAGPRVFDLQIALAAFDHGCREIWTHDRRFVALPGMKVVDPLA